MEDREVMQSNLPLVFANGTPMSLERLNLGQLQSFLLFVLKCERQSTDIAALSELEIPIWWPPDIPYHDELLHKNTQKGFWSRSLRKVINSCYSNYNAEFLLEFSQRLMVCTEGIATINIEDNGDGTRSMRSANNQKLLVTFRSENQDYDKQSECSAPFSSSSLLKGGRNRSLSSLVSTNNSSDPSLPKVGADIYLCDNCGADYESLKEVLEHEKTCGNNVFSPDTNFDSPCSSSSISSNGSNSASTNDDTSSGYSSSTTIKSNNSSIISNVAPRLPLANRIGSEETKIRHLEYFGLQRSDFKKQKERIVRPKPSSYAKFISIDMSSPLGIRIVRLGEMTVNDCIEACNEAAPERKGLRSEAAANICNLDDEEEFPVVYAKKLIHYDKSESSRRISHQYCFNNLQRKLRLQTLERGLSHRSFELFKKTRRKIPEIIISRLVFKNDRLLPVNTGIFSNPNINKELPLNRVGPNIECLENSKNAHTNKSMQTYGIELTPVSKRLVIEEPKIPSLSLQINLSAVKNDCQSNATTCSDLIKVKPNAVQCDDTINNQNMEVENFVSVQNIPDLIDLCSSSSNEDSASTVSNDDIGTIISDDDMNIDDQAHQRFWPSVPFQSANFIE